MAHILFFLEGDNIGLAESEMIRKLEKHSVVFLIGANESDRLAARWGIDAVCALSPFLVPPRYSTQFVWVDLPKPPEPPPPPPPPFRPLPTVWHAHNQSKA